MSADPLADLDLNLLRTLDVLLQHRSVTRAARVLGRSQPAVSHALARLRDVLDDPLLVRQGRALVPTPRAEALAGPVQRLLGELRDALQLGTTFDPGASTRTFRLACPDLLAGVVPGILAACADAPGTRIELVTRRGLDGVAAADVCLDVLPRDAAGVVARPLGTLVQAVATRRGHPLAAAPTLDGYCRWPHILVRTDHGGASLVERALEAVGRSRTVGLVAPTVLLALHVVARSDLLFTGPRQILHTLDDTLALELLEPPCPMPRVRVAALWQQRYADDPGHRWFRERVIGVVDALL